MACHSFKPHRNSTCSLSRELEYNQYLKSKRLQRDKKSTISVISENRRIPPTMREIWGDDEDVAFVALSVDPKTSTIVRKITE